MADKIATREAYGKALVDLGNGNEKVVVLDADLAGATMTKYFKAAHPDRFFDMGIAEADMVATSAGLSTIRPGGISSVPDYQEVVAHLRAI